MAANLDGLVGKRTASGEEIVGWYEREYSPVEGAKQTDLVIVLLASSGILTEYYGLAGLSLSTDPSDV